MNVEMEVSLVRHFRRMVDNVFHPVMGHPPVMGHSFSIV